MYPAKLAEINANFSSKCIAIGLRLKEIRKEKKLSQEIVHEKTGIDRVTITRLENGRSRYHSEKITNPNIYTLFRLADFYKTPFHELFV